MAIEQVLKDLELTIRRVSRDIRRKKGAVGGDKISDLAKLANSYTRMRESVKGDRGKVREGQPGFHESLCKSCD